MATATGTKQQSTILDVAREAGVSYQTVSRVINNRPDVAPETRKRIQAVISRLGYQPNASARSLASKRPRILGLITSDFSDYFFAHVIAGAEAEARTHGYHFMLGSTERNVHNEPAYVHLMTARHVAGMLFARPDTDMDNTALRELLNHSFPVVAIPYHSSGEPLTVVDVDNLDGGYQATQCLLDYGHHDIALISGPANWKSVQDRTSGYVRALNQAHIAQQVGWTVEGDWSYRSGYEAAQELLRRGQPFSALFAHNDAMAIGAIRALREAHLRVPQDVSVVGYDDISVAEYCDPPLTTIRQPVREVGAVAARLLIQAIEEPQREPTTILLKTTLIRRNSCIERTLPEAGYQIS